MRNLNIIRKTRVDSRANARGSFQKPEFRLFFFFFLQKNQSVMTLKYVITR